MIANHDIEKITIVNKKVAEIFLTELAIKSGRYPPKIKRQFKKFNPKERKPNFIYRIGDISNFEPFLLETQKSAGYNEKELIYPDYITRKLLFFKIFH